MWASTQDPATILVVAFFNTIKGGIPEAVRQFCLYTSDDGCYAKFRFQHIVHYQNRRLDNYNQLQLFKRYADAKQTTKNGQVQKGDDVQRGRNVFFSKDEDEDEE